MSERTKFGADLIQAMSEAAPHAHGKDVPGIRVHCVDVGTVEAKAVRKKLDLTQDEMVTVRAPVCPATKNGSKPSGSRAGLRVPASYHERGTRARAARLVIEGRGIQESCWRGSALSRAGEGLYRPLALVRFTRKRSRRR